jgi:Flp pilus assembly protein TadG
MSNRRFKSKRGSVMVEFACAAPLTFMILAGTFQFGYTFYVYNQLQLSIRGGVRYASLMDYKGTSSACIANTQNTIKNLVVYGSPTPTADAVPVVRGLSKAKVNVSFNPDTKGVPTAVTVDVSGFSVDGLFSTFTFNGKPLASVPYMGRYSPVECQL